MNSVGASLLGDQLVDHDFEQGLNLLDCRSWMELLGVTPHPVGRLDLAVVLTPNVESDDGIQLPTGNIDHSQWVYELGITTPTTWPAWQVFEVTDLHVFPPFYLCIMNHSVIATGGFLVYSFVTKALKLF